MPTTSREYFFLPCMPVLSCPLRCSLRPAPPSSVRYMRDPRPLSSRAALPLRQGDRNDIAAAKRGTVAARRSSIPAAPAADRIALPVAARILRWSLLSKLSHAKYAVTQCHPFNSLGYVLIAPPRFTLAVNPFFSVVGRSISRGRILAKGPSLGVFG